MSDVMPPPVHLDKVVEGLARNPALAPELVRRLFADRKGFGSVAQRPDLTDDMIAEIIAVDDGWLTRSLALNRSLPPAFRMMLAEHSDPSVRAAVVVGADDAPRELFERLLHDPDAEVREHVAKSDHVPTDLRAGLAADPDPKIRATVAQGWTQAPEAVRRLLLTDPEDAVRAGACETYYRRPSPASGPGTDSAVGRSIGICSDRRSRNPDLPPQHMRRLLALAGL